ncbi:hypothetical protein QUC26_04670 [Pseudomonas asiatica]|uniref:hypothetical protein n=1 Tax=Pseudomonas asiatica TaxID=2219225 RepID=UPI0025A21D9D|nr:hypothetical protein [Pseudomonas asiatica]WJM54468.1 hypothetical protein QUC26_04670 [Pseudomonas asiatica]
MKRESNCIADTIELLLLNQEALRAGLEEVALWLKQRGSTVAHENVSGALEILDANAEGIAKGIEALREMGAEG